MAPPPSEARQFELTRYALSTPPNDEAFLAMAPNEQERGWYRDIKRLRDEEPDSPLLEQLRQKLEDLEAVRITVTADKLITTTSEGTDIKRYSVEENLGDSIVVLEEGNGPEASRRAVITFVDDDNIILDKDGVRVPMVRVKGTPSASEAPRADGAAPGPTGDSEYDACVAAYYRCIDQMPAAEREVMVDLIAMTKRIFEEAQASPERRNSALESCKQAVALGRATFCAP